MALFGWSLTRKRERTSSYNFDDEDRRRSAEARRRAAFKRQLQDEIEILDLQGQKKELHDEVYGDDENSTDALFSSFLSKIMTVGAVSPPQPFQNAAASPSLSDEQLRGLKAKVPPKILKMAEQMSDQEIEEFAKLHYPDIYAYDEDTRRRALAILRE